MNNQEVPMLVPVPTAARQLSLGPTKTWQLIRDGKLPVVRVGRRTFVRREDLEKFVGALMPAGDQKARRVAR